LPADDDRIGAANLVAAVRELRRTLAQPATIADLPVTREAYAQALPDLVTLAEGDSDLVTSPRLPTRAELHDLFEHAYDGRDVDF
jgi:alcohol dehydrogenase class IV